jgi:hypothetical protein
MTVLYKLFVRGAATHASAQFRNQQEDSSADSELTVNDLTT